VALLAVPFAARAQQPAIVRRIGYVSGTGSATDHGPYVEAFRQGLRDLGYIEGRDFSIEYRGAAGNLDRVPNMVSELVQLKVDVIVAPFPIAIRAAKQATNTIPIVMVTGLDPVASGMVASLARPSGNITGVVTLAEDLDGKRMELLKEVVPRLSRVAILWAPNDPAAATHFKQYTAAAQALKIQIQSLETGLDIPDVDGAFQNASKARVEAIITITTAALFVQQKRIADLGVKYRLPTMFAGSAWVEAGGLMSYSTNELEAFRHASAYVDKILKSTKPADLPIEQLAKFELVINLKTANAIDVTIPQSLLLRADKVIH